MSTVPVVVETAISPLRLLGEDQVYDTQGLIQQGLATLDAGTSIVHHHHDFQADLVGTEQEMTQVARGLVAKYPDAVFYGDFVQGRTIQEQLGHIPGLIDANLARMIPVDPGVTRIGGVNELGEPVTRLRAGSRFQDANFASELALKHDVPLSIGIYEPGNLRWAVWQQKRGQLPVGSYAKFYFCTYDDIFTPGKPALNWGLAPTKSAVDALVDMLEGCGLAWMASVQGRPIHEYEDLARYVLEMGGHLRTGNEDAAGNTTFTNAECTQAIVGLAESVGRPVAHGVSEIRAALAAKAA
jgi:3-keto-5-aminohexanoate cleavage enzyme